MVVALADSFFFDVDPGAARSKVLLFLVISFAPFLIVAPLIGPVIDRIRGGRRFVVQAVAAARIVLQLLMMRFADELALFPLVFAALVLQKTYSVSKSALVPSVVRTERELVEANSKLGLIAGVSGVVAVFPAALLQVAFGSAATLGYGALLFVVALVAATRLPRDVVAAGPASQRQRIELSSTSLQLAAVAMLLLRCCVGFVLFHLAFSFRTQGRPHVVVRARRGAVVARHDGGQRDRPAAAVVVARGQHDRRRPRVADRGGCRRRDRRRQAGRHRARGRRQLRRRARAAGVREHRAARSAERQPRPGVRPLRDPLPVRMGGRRNGAGGDRDPRPRWGTCSSG